MAETMEIDSLIENVFPGTGAPELVAQLLISMEHDAGDDSCWTNAMVDLFRALTNTLVRSSLQLNKEQCLAILKQIQQAQELVQSRLTVLSPPPSPDNTTSSKSKSATPVEGML